MPECAVKKSTYKNWIEEGARLPRVEIQVLRDKFIKEIKTCPHKFSNKDIERVLTVDWIVERCILEYPKDEERKYRTLRNGMRWRMLNSINQLKLDIFPVEFFKAGLVRLYGCDYDGDPVLIIRANIYKTDYFWLPHYYKLIDYWAERADRVNRGCGITVVIDTRYLTKENYDFAMIQYFRDLMVCYYPKLVKVAVFHKPPNVFRRVVRDELKEKFTSIQLSLFKTTSKTKQLYKYVPSSQLPYFLGGYNHVPYCKVPVGALTADEVVHRYRKNLRGASAILLERQYHDL